MSQSPWFLWLSEWELHHEGRNSSRISSVRYFSICKYPYNNKLFMVKVLTIFPSIWMWRAVWQGMFGNKQKKQVGCLWTCPPSLSSSLKRCFVLTRVSNKNTRFVLTRGMLDQTTGISEQPQILLSSSPQGSIPCGKNPHSLITHVLPQPASLSCELLSAEADFSII